MKVYLEGKDDATNTTSRSKRRKKVAPKISIKVDDNKREIKPTNEGVIKMFDDGKAISQISRQSGKSVTEIKLILSMAGRI